MTIFLPFGPIVNHHYGILLRAFTVTTLPSNSLPPGQLKKRTFLDTTVYLENCQIRTDLNPRSNTSTFAWTVATPYTAKLPSPRAKHSDSDAFAWKNRFLRIGPTSLNSTFFCRVTMSST